MILPLEETDVENKANICIDNNLLRVQYSPVIQMSERDRLRFFEKVEKKRGCWEWKYTRKATDGPTRAIFGLKGKAIPAARLMWLITKGEIPWNMWVLHKCDNGNCVNPDHLFLGTASDNVRDSVKKGRWHGTRNGKVLASR